MKKYLITGGTGFLGRAVIAYLLTQGAEVSALILKDDPLVSTLPQGVFTVIGDVCDETSLIPLFENADEDTCVIHCAGIVSVASKPEEKLYKVNVDGTRNILRMCSTHRVGKLIYISSVHAIPEKPKGTVIVEPQIISPELVEGHYAKSKAMASSLVMDAVQRGLNACIVFPSGIIGPEDLAKGSITHMLLSFVAGKLPLAVKGGYDFVDVRDVAEGIVACAERGKPGQGYILSGHYATVRDILAVVKENFNLKQSVNCLPIFFAKLIAPAYERFSLRKKKPLYFTPYSIAVLDSNGLFSHQAATQALGYTPRPLQTTLRDTATWLQRQYNIYIKKE